MYFGLGNLYLSAAMKRRGVNVCVADFRAIPAGVLPPADFYGFSITTPQVSAAKELAREVKGKTIVGGPHASLLPESCIGSFDYVVKGEGEYVLWDILCDKEQPGLVTAPRIDNLDRLPYPDWDAVAATFSNSLYDGERYGLVEL